MGVDSPTISADAEGIHLAFLVREASADGSVASLGTNGVLWTALYQDGAWSTQKVPSPLGTNVYAESPVLVSEGNETLLAFRRFDNSGDTGTLGQVAMSQLRASPSAPLYVTDQPVQNWQPAIAINPLNNNAVILKVARIGSVSAASMESAQSFDSIASTQVVMSSQSATLSAAGDPVEEVGISAAADFALDPLHASTLAPAPNQQVTVDVTVRNAGRSTAEEATVSLYRGEAGDGTLISSLPVPTGLEFNAGYKAQFIIQGSGGKESIYAEVTTEAENQSTDNDRATLELGNLSVPTLVSVGESRDYAKALSMSWVPNAGEYVTGYRILRSASEEGPYELAGEASVTTFDDTLAERGENVCYAVQAYNANTISAQSTPPLRRTAPCL